MSNASARNEARAVISILAELGDSIVSYIGDDGEISTVGYMDKESEFLIGDARTSADMTVLSLLAEDVPNPKRGDRVIDEDGGAWKLLDSLPSDDPHVIVWSVQVR